MFADRRLWSRAVLAIVVLYGAYWAYRLAIAWLGPLAVLAVGPVITLLLLLAAGWAWRRFGDRLLEAASAAARGVSEWLGAARAVRVVQRRFPAGWRFLAARVDPHAATGLGLSVAVLAALGGLWAFLEILFEVVGGSAVAGIDHRVIHLMAELRTPGLDRVMLAITYAGSTRAVVVLASAAVVVALLFRRRRDAALVVISLVAASTFFSVVKLLVHRPRPSLYDARIVQAGFSFPSGHATMAVAFWGTIGLLVVLALRSGWTRILAAALAGVTVLMIGTSRIYLGVHYPSDVLGGWIGGAVWVALAYVVVRGVAAGTRTTRDRGSTAGPTRPLPALAAFVVVAAAVTFLVVTRPAVPAPPPSPPRVARLVSPDYVDDLVLDSVPHHTQSLLGHRQEPVNLVFVATRGRLRDTFRAAGWTEAARLTSRSIWEATRATMTGRPDSAGPVTPSFLGDEPETLAFSLPVGQDFSRRHHIRIWETRYETPDGRTVWLATASYDAGFAIVAGTLLPAHQIAPDIDNERDFIARDLDHTGLVTRTDTLQLVPPETGTNAFGSTFFTYGKAFVLWLDGDGTPAPDSGKNISLADYSRPR